MANKGEINNMDQEYKADLCCPRNTSAPEVDNSVGKLTGDSTVRNVGNEEISPEDSKSNGSTSSSNDNSYNEYQSITRDEMKNVIHVSLKRKNVHVVSIEDEEQNSKKAKLEEKKPEINTSDQDVKQGPSASASTATVIKRPEADILPKLYRLLRDDDIIENGLVAKDPNGHPSVAQHVANGSKRGQSRYISTCSSWGAAQKLRRLKTRSHRFGNGRKDIVEIDVAKLPMEVEIIDLRTRIDREIYESHTGMVTKERFHKFADKYSEVLLVGWVPPECLTLT